MDCLQLGRNRRKRIVCPFPGRKRRCRSSDQRSGYLFLRAEMVARQQEATLGRSVAAVALCRCCEQDRDASRSGQIRRDRNFQLVAGQPMDRVGTAGRKRNAAGVYLLVREQTEVCSGGQWVLAWRASL